MSLVIFKDQHDEHPGLIYRTVSQYLPELPSHLTDKGEKLLTIDRSIDMERWYVNAAGVLIERPAMPIVFTKSTIVADGVDEALISGIPAGATLYLDGQTVELEGSQLNVASDMPAVYRIHFAKWPYLDWRLEVMAVAA